MRSGLWGFILIICVAANVFAGEVHKWVDKNGKVHFGDHPPQGVKAVDITKNKTEQHAPAGAAPFKQIDPNLQSEIDGFAKGLLNVKPVEGEFECSDAISNVQYAVDQMLEAARRNVQTGYANADQVEQMKEKLTQLRSSLSQQDCASASGVKQEFYRCISSPYNHLMGCAQKFNFEGL